MANMFLSMLAMLLATFYRVSTYIILVLRKTNNKRGDQVLKELSKRLTFWKLSCLIKYRCRSRINEQESA